MSVFDLVATLTLDTSGYSASLQEAEGKASGFASKAAGGMKVLGTATAAMAAGTAAVTGALIAQTKGVAQYGDNIDKMSQKLGISATAYQEWDAILKHSGASIESLKAPMKTLATQAQSNASEFQKLGISQQEVASLSQEDLFSRVISGLQGMEEGTERTALASKLLGKGAVEMGALLNTSAEDTEAMRQAVHDLGGVMSDEAVKDAAKFQDQLQDMQTAFAGLKRGMLSEFMPSLTTVMEGITQLFSGENTDQALENISKGMDEFVSKMSDSLPKAMETGGKIAGALAKAIIQNAPKMAEAGMRMILDLTQSLIGALPTIASTGIEVVTTFAEGIAGALPELIPTAVDAVLSLADALISNLPKIVEAAGKLIEGLAQGIMNALPKILQTLPVLIGKLAAGIVKSIPTILATGAKLVVMLAKGIISAIPQLLAAVPKMIASFAKSLFSGFKNINFSGVGKAILNGITGAFKAIGKIGSTIGGALKGGLEKAKNINWGEVGKNAITKIGNGLSSVGGFLKDKFGNAFNSAKDFVQNIDWSNVGTKIKDTISNGLQTLGELGGTVKEKLGSALEAVKEIDWSETFDSAITTILDAWMDLGDKTGEVLKSGFEKAKEVLTETDWEEVNNSIIEKLSALGELLPEIDWAGMGTTIVESLGTGISSAGDTIGFAFDSLSSSAKQAWEMLDWAGTGRNAVTFISSGVSSIGSTVSSAVSSIASTASSAFSSIPWSSAGTQAISFIKSGISSIGSTIGTALRTIANNAKTAFTSINWSSVGSNIIKGIANGIRNGASMIVNAAKDAAKRAFDAAKNFLGIESPSKLFRDKIGKMMALGLGLGFETNIPVKEMQKSLDSMTKSLSASDFDIADALFGDGELDIPYYDREQMIDIVGSADKKSGENNYSNVGDIIINVYPSEGMNERALADMVSNRLATEYRRRKMSYA